MRAHLLAVLLLLPACNDAPLGTGDGGAGDGATGDLAQAPDLATPPDLAVAPSIGIGKACPTGAECGPGQICLDERLSPGLPPAGYCTKQCASDADCGGDAFCSLPLPMAGRLCFAKCLVGDTCAEPDRVCGRRLIGAVDLGSLACVPGNPKAVDGAPCVTFGDCNRNGACLDNPFEAPGGMCVTVGCTVGDNSTCAPGGDGVCVPLGGNAICLDACAMASDCRVGQSYTCAPLPNTMLRVCALPHQRPGAACARDTDCGPAASPWRCLQGGSFPRGYCSGALGGCDARNENTCPFDSTCYDPTPMAPKSGDEFCALGCAMNADCRMADGYTCKLANPMMMNGPRVCAQ